VTQNPSAQHEPEPNDSTASPQNDKAASANAFATDASGETGAQSSDASPCGDTSPQSSAKPANDESACGKPSGCQPAAKPAGESAVSAIKPLQAEIAAVKDRELRVRAELENYRKRAARELHDSLRYANLPILRDLLPVLDNVERAIQAAEKNADAAGLLEGVKMMHQQLMDLLQRYQCEQINALHVPFDPNLHHAILQQHSDEFPPNTVVMVTQNGYQLHDRVVRPSQVIVSTAK
jgi:molecular chaperone GrpE